MSKQGEIDYLKNIGEGGGWHAANKPFVDPLCHIYLIRMSALFALLPEPPAKLLDLGCGGGWTSCFLARRGYEVTGIDISEDMIKEAKNKKENEKIENLNFYASDYESLNYKDEFDCVVFFDSLHHAENENIAILNSYKALKKGGLFIAIEPGHNHSKNAASIQAVKKYNVTEKDMPPATIINAGKKAGFREFKVFPEPDLISNLYFRSPNRLMWRILKIPFLKDLAILFHKNYAGVVVMYK